MSMRRFRWKVLLLLPLLSLGIAQIDLAATRTPGNWRDASREPVGLAPDPATTSAAVVQVYAARAVRWRGLFGVHTWIAAKPTDADAYTVYEVTRWNRRRNGSTVAISQRVPDARWYGNEPELIAELRGADADAAIERIDAAARDYVYADEYHVWPGPNSNTFTAEVLRAVPELRADLPPNAIGKDYLGGRLLAPSPSGTGFQFSLFGMLGLLVGLEEGVEVNLLGMTIGIDPLGLGVKLPFAGQFALLDSNTAHAAQPEDGDERAAAATAGRNEAAGEAAAAAATSAVTQPTRRYTFSWPYSEASVMQPRGGTTQGPAVTLVESPTAAWQALREPGLSDFERDRRAILAMAGEFRTSFDFIETVGFTAGFEPDQPYQSWATEKVDVIEDSGDRIVLQHIIVMQYVDAEGNVQGPVVQKHWRQDWVYQDTSIHGYSGHDRWSEQTFTSADVAGRWSQAVFQVDDSPRYEALGRWVHESNYSAWTSERTWRPLPRRESSVRDDYHALVGTNRHTITPTGWVHEEENLKAVLSAVGQVDPDQGFLSRELGVNRYEAIDGFDFSARDIYWRATSDFWADVRAEWQRIYAERESFALVTPDSAPELFAPMFIYAAELEAGNDYDAAAGQAFIRDTLAQYLQ